MRSVRDTTILKSVRKPFLRQLRHFWKAKALQMGQIEGAMSSLSIAVAGCMTVAGAILYSTFI